MLMPNQTGKDFENSGRRLIYNFIALRADFKSVDSDTVTEESQKQFYDFISDFYLKIYDDPSIISMVIEPDETEERPHKGRVCEAWNHAHLEPRKLRRKNQKIICDLFNTLEFMGVTGVLSGSRLIVQKSALELNKAKLNKTLKTLSSLGIAYEENDTAVSLWSEKYLLMCPAWKLLAEISKENVGKDVFIRTVFNIEKDNILDVFYDLSGMKDVLKNFIDTLIKNGFTSTTTHKPFSSDGLEVKFTKEYMEERAKEPIYISFSCSYQFRYYNQICYNFLSGKNPFIFLHNHFDKLSPVSQELVYRFSGTCNSCGSCNAMNRESAMKRENPYSYISVDYKGKKANLCHVYKAIETQQGYYRKAIFDLDEKFMADILDLYDFFESFETNKGM